jgi:hypothetical protein
MTLMRFSFGYVTGLNSPRRRRANGVINPGRVVDDQGQDEPRQTGR